VVVVERAVTEVPRPTLFDIVIVWEEVTVGRLVKISSSSVLPSLQLPTEKVNLKSFASMREREVQLVNISPKKPVVTADTLRAGTLTRDVQPEKKKRMSVSAAKLNIGMLVRDKQFSNILLADAHAAVLNKGTATREVQF
jgi:hypothetical protein